MAEKQLNVAMIGQGFMGRAHSNAWSQVGRFFQTPLCAVQHTVCGRDAARLAAFARTWGWKNTSTDYRRLVRDETIDLVDVCTPNNSHAEISLAALAAGKNVACEKPIAGTLAEGRQMAAAAAKAKGQKTFVWYNYRRCPAVAFAHQLVRAGKIGQIRHVRGYYLQDWADENVPLMWRFDKKVAGAGSHGDLNAHIIDMTRFVTGQEITEICGAMAQTFIKERNVMSGGIAGGLAAGVKGAKKKGKVTVDDAVAFLARFSGGAMAYFEATRMATGYHNRNGFEIHGTKGAIRFNFERMNELDFYDATDDRGLAGWRTIIATFPGKHPYAVYWPDAHVIGYEHGFTNMAYDILLALAGRRPTVPLPDFQDAYQTQRVLEAAMLSAKERSWIRLKDVK